MPDLLSIRDLRIHFDTEEGVVPAVDGVDLSLAQGKTLCLVGESGCGKSVTCHAILRLTPPNGRIVSGSIMFEGADLLTVDRNRMTQIRGSEIAMIFQDPMNALNPVHTVGGQLVESLILHQSLNHRDAMNEAFRLLELVGIPEAKARLKEYPHQLSGGMSQRVMIAMALACRPKLLIADEPTSALDVTIQAQILDLLRGLQDELQMSIILVTHDLGVVAEMADSVAVMYCGGVVEEAAVHDLFHRPMHPYTEGLLRSLPRVDRDLEDLTPIEGWVPSPFELPPGCRFEPRCPYATDQCRVTGPALEASMPRHTVACYHPRGSV
ncbi:MAG: ABC transporter ATP-binding protein [Alphaproteobacteria bacterium]|nr:ABC transporter ATP-binding protein [Alphaproteobacteria bacterium]